jgi:23S rRNA (adenine2030-N6)-methyltransferase
MLSYQHEYHCGNHGDVLKHAVLALVLEALKRKEAPFRVLDANAGSGLYDLTGPAARRTGEFRGGIGRVLERVRAEPPPPAVAAALAPYLAAIRAVNATRGEADALVLYPGSPAIARHGLRSGDHLELLELHPGALDALRANLGRNPFGGGGRDRQVHIHGRDAREGLPALLPPPERRGLVLLDPSYEVKDEFRKTRQLLAACHARFPTGIYLVWYPLLAHAEARRFVPSVAGSGLRKIWQAELQVEGNDHDGLRGSGMLVVNPPWGMEESLGALMPWLWETLSVEGRGHWTSAWLVPE